MGLDFKFIFSRMGNINYAALWGLVGITFLITACQTPLPNSSEDVESNSETTPLVRKEADIKENIGISKVIRTSVQQQAVQQKSTQKQELPEVNPLELDGSIRIAGSSIVFSISQAITERFFEEGYSQPIESASITTTKGFEIFCQHQLDIVNAYRPITPDELSACQQAGRQLESFEIAEDALAIVISSQNEFLPTNLTRNEIKQIFTAEYWSDINPEWPDTEIAPTLYDLTSLDTQQIVTTIFEGNREELANAPNLHFVEDEEDLISNALTNPDLISVTSYGDYSQNQDTFKLISIDGIAPTAIDKYPMVRPLYIYADIKDIKSRPEIAGFINYYLTNVNEAVNDLGYFPVSQETLEESEAKLLQLLD